MPAANDLPELLTTLTTAVARMEDHLHPATKAPSETPTNTTFGPRPPATISVLSYLQEHVDPTLDYWCTTIARETHEPYPRRPDSTHAATWLHHHTNHIAQAAWCTDFTKEIQAVIDGINTFLTPEDQTQFLTLEDLARASGCSPAAMRKRIERGIASGTVSVEIYTISGRNYYRKPAGL